MLRLFYLLWILYLLTSCNKSPVKKESFPSPAPKMLSSDSLPKNLTREIYYDKILGMLVGSAIGDAMGAPVEMWGRKYIRMQYGFIDTLVNVIRDGSPEGPWEDNMVPGATTDDTRWKYLLTNYLVTQKQDSLDDVMFANYIVALYKDEMEQLKSVDTFDPEPLERQLRHMTWLQEWAKVAKPYAEDNIRRYSYALNRFYGGEMVCAGMLYAPVIGGIYPGQEEKAYIEAYRLGIFDIGYARDIMALTSAYVAKAMEPNVSYDQITFLTSSTDPLKYFNSRLVRRLAQNSYLRAREIIYEIDQMDSVIIGQFKIPDGYKGSSIDFARLENTYRLLDNSLQDIPFHAGEIHLINLVALEYSNGDFMKAMEFIVNFGRDNDTVGAVIGAILGAYHGYDNLPQGIARSVLSTSKEVIGIDLELLARKLTGRLFTDEVVSQSMQ